MATLAPKTMLNTGDLLLAQAVTAETMSPTTQAPAIAIRMVTSVQAGRPIVTPRVWDPT